jgi:hypothetical protein
MDKQKKAAVTSLLRAYTAQRTNGLNKEGI